MNKSGYGFLRNSDFVSHTDALDLAASHQIVCTILAYLKNLCELVNMGDAMDMVENMKGEVMVISSEHEGGKQLESLGGMAAILRYQIS